MATSTAAHTQALFEGVALPALRDELLAYAREQEAPPPVLDALRRPPRRTFSSLDDVGEAIAPVQPPGNARRPPPPHEESGDPPGGAAYADPAAEPGAVPAE